MTAALTMVMENPYLRGFAFGGVVVTFAMTVAGLSIWYERKFAGRMQNRPGPTEVGPFGLLQAIADVLKMLQKEDIVPRAADKALFNIAPPMVLGLALAGLAVIPWDAELIVADLHVGLLFALAVGSLMVFPVWIAGWGSNNKYALLGGMRSAAQGISYEIPLLLSAVVPIVLTGSFRMGDIVEAQATHGWYAFWPPGPGFLAFVLFFLTSLAESNRIPFDIPEAESELISGVTVEYGGIKWGLFPLAEYVHTFIASALASVLFLGGYDMGPLGSGLHWMLLKTFILYLSIFWIRWSWMRYRADQLMAICWKLFVPLSLILVMVAALWKHFVLGGA